MASPRSCSFCGAPLGRAGVCPACGAEVPPWPFWKRFAVGLLAGLAAAGLMLACAWQRLFSAS